MKKLIMSLAAAAIMAAGFGAYKAYESYNVSADSLLKMNLNVLAQNETGGSEGGRLMSILMVLLSLAHVV